MVKITKTPRGKFFKVPGINPRTAIFVADNKDPVKIIENFRRRYEIKKKADFQNIVKKEVAEL